MGGGDRRRAEGNRRRPSEQRGHKCYRTKSCKLPGVGVGGLSCLAPGVSLPRSLWGVPADLHPGSVAGSERKGIQPSIFLHALLKTRAFVLQGLFSCLLRIKPSVSCVLKKTLYRLSHSLENRVHRILVFIKVSCKHGGCI